MSLNPTDQHSPQSPAPVAPLQPTPEPAFAALVAIDWADEKHAVALRAAGQTKTERITLEQKPEALSPGGGEETPRSTRATFPLGPPLGQSPI